MRNQTTDPLIGREIDGYKIEKMLGEGGMARVYRGYDVHLQRYVAIKIIDPQQHNNRAYEERFKQEARAVAQLQNANIVSVYRFGQVKGLYYMAMAYIQGSDLRWVLQDYHQDGELMPYTAALDVITQIGRALDYAHSKGVIHRDIKPSNIMIAPSGEAILTDFGLALVATEATKGEAFGSPHYIAPEQAIGAKGVVPQSDLYSLGVVLYEMLTGAVPFTVGSAMQIAMAHITDPLPDPLALNPDLHPAFIPVLQTALAKEPADRYQTGAKLVAALRAAVKQAKDDERLATQPGSKPGGRKKTTPTPTEAPSRLSLITLPEKVQKHNQINPLPETPTFPEAPDFPRPAPSENVWRPVSAVSDETERLLPKPATKPSQASRKTGRRRLIITLLAVFLVVDGVIAAFFLLRDQPASPPPPTTMILEGRVTALDATTLTIFDTTIVIADADAAALAEVEIGDMLRLEGNFTFDEQGRLLVRSISSITER